MKNVVLTSLLFGSCLLAGCSSLSYDSVYDETVDFSAYSTYGWMPRPDEEGYDTILKQQFDRAIENQLNQRGLSKSETDPDLLVTYHLNTERRVTGATIDNYGYGWGRWGGGGTVNYQEYEEGTLFLDIVDSERKEVVWRGTATGAVGDKQPTQEKIDKVVTQLLAAYPPEKAS